MKTPSDLRYSEEHEWVKIDGDIATIGITDFAQQQLGDIVFVEIETEGDNIEKGEIFGTVEAVKTVSDLFMPVSGTVIEVNPELEGAPETINSDPYGKGWMIKVKMDKPHEYESLMNAVDYKQMIG